MCGISGIITKNILPPELKEAARRMSSAQNHRGPDGEGNFCAENLRLDSRRLSIIDPHGGWQPLYNEDKSLVLMINGEIYNYIELREKLKKSGHKFQTDADGEVIVHLYEENPHEFINHLRGMFAFALYDVKRERLILARDRMGEKPLYLYRKDGCLLFASEMKSLLASRVVPFELDAEAVNLYFHYQYVPEPLTAVKNVRKLDAATMLTIDVADWKFEEKVYWRMADAPPVEGEPAEIIRRQLEEVSELIVRSDVPVGVALSGGLDSSVVAAFAVKNQPNLAAFSVGYAGRPESDERADAEKLAKYLKIPFFDVELETEKIVEFFPELNYWRDDPIADIAGFGYYAVMKLARENNVPVLLQGQGGDELFWGYPQLRAAFEATNRKTKLLEHPFSQSITQILRRDFGGFRASRRGINEQLKNPDRLVFYDQSPDFQAAKMMMPTFYTAQFNEQIRDTDAHSIFTFRGGWSDLETTLTNLVCSTYLRENGIAQGDRLGMASSVELRLPLVDYKFVETIIGLRKTNSDAHLPPKFWLREAVKNVLPDWAVNRPKRGFAPPVRDWYDAIFAAYADSLNDGCLVQSGVLSREGASLLARRKAKADSATQISFCAIVLEQWCRQMMSI